jgi:hypothetical protein
MGRTLVVERHEWETSGSSHQVQFPKDAQSAFFGTFSGHRTVRIFDPPSNVAPSRTAIGLISYYSTSDTCRINKVLELGALGHASVFIEEITSHGIISYDLWWFEDPAAKLILAQPWNWQQGKSNQHGPGRYWTILAMSGPRTVAGLKAPKHIKK